MEIHPELTNFNGGAYDLLRIKNHGSKLPFWLCMSKEAKADAQLHFANWCRAALEETYNMSDEQIVAFINSTPKSAPVRMWQKIEMDTAATRAAGSLEYFL